ELGGGEAAGQAGGQRRGGQQGQDRLLHGGRSFVRWAVLTSSDRKNVTALGRGAQRVQRSRSTRSSHRCSCHSWHAWLHICVGSGSATPARCSARPANRPSTMSTRIKATRRPVCSWLIATHSPWGSLRLTLARGDVPHAHVDGQRIAPDLGHSRVRPVRLELADLVERPAESVAHVLLRDALLHALVDQDVLERVVLVRKARGALLQHLAGWNLDHSACSWLIATHSPWASRRRGSTGSPGGRRQPRARRHPVATPCPGPGPR